MKQITFVTTNRAKFEWAKKVMERFEFVLLHKSLAIKEAREFEVEVVAQKKAEVGMHNIDAPFIVDDSGFQIRCLNNFPNAYAKLAVEKLGVDALCRLAADKEDKTTVFVSVLAYVDENKGLHLFKCEDIGSIPPQPRGSDLKGFGELARIHIPAGFTKTLAEMDKGEFEEYEKKTEPIDHYTKFAKWLQKTG